MTFDNRPQAQVAGTAVNVTGLTLLVRIIDAGNLSEAARRLKTSRANVSYHLAQLERSVGQQLLRRTTRRIEPTELGLKLYDHGLAIENELSAAREAVTSLGEQLQGRVRLSVPSGYGQVVMAPWLLAFKQQYPGIVLDVMFENTVEDLLREGVDVAVRILSEPPQNLVARQMGTVRYVACASRRFAAEQGMPMRLEQLRDLPVISAAVIGRQLRVAACLGDERHEVLLEPTLISENFLFLREAVLAGIGIALVPDYLIGGDLDRGAVVTALDDWSLSIFGAGLHLLYMPNRHHTRAMATFIDYLLEQARRHRAVPPSTGRSPPPADPTTGGAPSA
jgi:DNA-binding transcriptional LysR family regulator